MWVQAISSIFRCNAHFPFSMKVAMTPALSLFAAKSFLRCFAMWEATHVALDLPLLWAHTWNPQKLNTNRHVRGWGFSPSKPNVTNQKHIKFHKYPTHFFSSTFLHVDEIPRTSPTQSFPGIRRWRRRKKECFNLLLWVHSLAYRKIILMWIKIAFSAPLVRSAAAW